MAEHGAAGNRQTAHISEVSDAGSTVGLQREPNVLTALERAKKLASGSEASGAGGGPN